MVRKRGDQVGVRARPHGLRHSAITSAGEAATEAGLPVPEVLSFSRHRSLSTLMVYADRLRDSQGKPASAVAASVM